MDLRVVLDSPGDVASRIQIAKLGDFKDPSRYGEFSITKENVAHWQENLAKLPGGRAVIDLDHRAERAPRNSEAAGWITGVHLDGDRVMADPEWTPVGKSAIEDKRYLFFSPVFGDFKDEQGVIHKDTLKSGALTNMPFLSSLPALQLASDERMEQALHDDPVQFLYSLALDGSLGEDVKTLASTDQRMRDKALKEGHALPDGSYPIPDVAHLKAAITLAQSGHGKSGAAKTLIKRRAKELGAENLLPDDWKPAKKVTADSRPPMPLSKDILKLLGIEDEDEQKKILDLAAEDDADEAKVLEAIEAAKPEPEEKPEPTKTLEQQAKDEGKVVLDSTSYEQLRSGAAAGAESKKQLDTMTFETAFEKAKGKGQAVEADREFYLELPLETAVKRLEKAPQIVNVKPIGKNVSTEELDAPENVNPQAYQLDQEVKKHMAEKDMKPEQYVEALHEVEAKRLAA